MSVHHRATITVTNMLLAPILMDHSNAHAKMDSMVMDMIVLILMSVQSAMRVIWRLLRVSIRWVRIIANVTMDIRKSVTNVLTSTNAN